MAFRAFREGHLAGGEQHNSSALNRCAFYSTQRALDVNEESTIPYGTGTDESDARLPDTLSDPAEMEIRDVGARTSLTHMARCGLRNELDDGPQVYMREQGENSIGMQESCRMHLGMPLQGNHESSHGNSTHLFGHRKKAFRSGIESDGCMRRHGSVGLSSSMKWGAGVQRAEMEDTRDDQIEHSNADSRTLSNSATEEERDRSGEEKAADRGDTNRVEEEATSFRLSSSSEAAYNINNGRRAVNMCSSKKEAEEDEEDDNEDDDKNAQRLQYQKDETLIYTLRRNPKRSRRFLDEEEAPVDVNMVDPPPPSTSGSFSKKTSSSALTQARACTECGKEFPSWKALFGHMRCHPEREWRGIQRPDHCYGGVGDSIATSEGFVKRRAHHHHHRSRHRRSEHAGNAISRRKLVYNLSQVGQQEYAADDEEGEGDECEEEEDEDEVEIKAEAVDSGCNNLESKSGDRATTLHNSKCINHVSSMTSVAMELEVEDAVKVMVEEQVSDTKSIEAVYVNDDNCRDGAAYLDHYHHGLTRRRRRHRLEQKIQQLQQKQQQQHEQADCDSLHGLAFLRGKRSRRPRLTMRWLRRSSPDLGEKNVSPSQTEERDMANCLVMLALAGSAISASDESTFSSGGEEDNSGAANMAAAPPLATFSSTSTSNNSGADKNIAAVAKFQCSNCKRSFKSHQALGGHRASHKKVQGCFARTSTASSILEVIPANIAALPVENNSKGHQCSICFRVFATGQALGGHKRCHWTSDKRPATSIFTSTGGSVSGVDHVKLLLDLNLPAPTEEEDAVEEIEEHKRLCLPSHFSTPSLNISMPTSATKKATKHFFLSSLLPSSTIGLS